MFAKDVEAWTALMVKKAARSVRPVLPEHNKPVWALLQFGHRHTPDTRQCGMHVLWLCAPLCPCWISLVANTRVHAIIIRDIRFVDGAAVASQTQQEPKGLMGHFSQAGKDFGLTISLKKTSILRQYTLAPPVITNGSCDLDVIREFIYLVSTGTDTPSLDTEIIKKIGKRSDSISPPYKLQANWVN